MNDELLAPLFQQQVFQQQAETLARLHSRLAQEAARSGRLDIVYRTVDSPLGPLLLAATSRGLLRVAYQRQDHEQVLQSLANTVSPRILHVPSRLDSAAKELDEYFAGRRKSFGLPLDLRLSPGFRRSVLQHLPQIGYGRTESYAQVALAAGSPRAVRAVGSACANNPLPLIVPCHRVVRSDGSFGGYVGGEQAQRALLLLEAGNDR